MQGENSVEDDPFTYSQMVEAMIDFLEVAFHYILYLRSVYPRESFIKCKVYGVPVWQNRHPVVKAYIAGILRAAAREMKRGILQRLTFIVKSAQTNLPLERFLFDVGYMDLSTFPSEEDKDTYVLLKAPNQRQMKLLFQAFLIRLSALETGLTDNDPDEELTYAVVITCKDGEEPDLRPVVDYTSYEGNPRTTEKQPLYHPPEGPSSWSPALVSDGLHPSQMSTRPPAGNGQDTLQGNKGNGKSRFDGAAGDAGNREGRMRVQERIRPIRAVETGVVDINLMVQETMEKFERARIGSGQSHEW